MFQSRVMGVGSQRPGEPQFGPYGDIMADIVARGQRACIGPDCQMDGGSRLTVCHSQSPAGTCKPPDWMPPVAVPDAPGKPTGFSVPLLLGAAYLLLS